MAYDPNQFNSANPYGAPLPPQQGQVPPTQPGSNFGTQQPPYGYGGPSQQVPPQAYQNPYGQTQMPQQGYPQQPPYPQQVPPTQQAPQMGMNQSPYFANLPPMTPALERPVDEESGKTEEELRLERMRKRIYWLFIGLSLIALSFVIWEIVDFIGGFH